MIITGDAGIYRVTWENDSIEFIFERIRESSRAITSEVWVKDSALPNSHVAFDTLNLGSQRTKRSFANMLKDIHPREFGYQDMVEAAATRVLLEFRKGEPVVNVKDVSVETINKYRVKPFIFNQYPTLLYGDGGIGKSFWALYLAIMAKEGWLTDDIEPEPCNVLYLDWESSDQDIAERTDQIARGMEFDHRPEILYRYCARPLRSDFDFIKRTVIEKDIGLLIIDSAGPACGKPIDVDDVIAFFTALRGMKVSSLIIGHKPANGENPFGSVYWRNYSRSLWEMKADQNPGGESTIAFYNTKVNRGPIEAPRAYRMAFNGETAVAFTPTDIKGSEELYSVLPLKSRIYQFLKEKGRPVHYKNIANALGEKENTILVSLRRNVSVFVSPEQGVYALAYREQPVNEW